MTPLWFIAALRTNVVPIRRFPINLKIHVNNILKFFHHRAYAHAVRLHHSAPSSRSSDLVIHSPNFPRSFINGIDQTNHKRDADRRMCTRGCISVDVWGTGVCTVVKTAGFRQFPSTPHIKTDSLKCGVLSRSYLASSSPAQFAPFLVLLPVFTTNF